jgi:hypothetical protein
VEGVMHKSAFLLPRDRTGGEGNSRRGAALRKRGRDCAMSEQRENREVGFASSSGGKGLKDF